MARRSGFPSIAAEVTRGKEGWASGRWITGLMLETKEILKSSTSDTTQLFFLEAMNALRPASLVRLMRWSLVPALVAGLLAGSVSPSLAADPAALALLRPARESHIELDLSKRQINLVPGEQQLETWPLAIGDPKTPTPMGDFAILNKRSIRSM